MKKYILVTASIFQISLNAQTVVNPVSATPFAERMKGIEQKKLLLQNSLVSNVPFKSVGPTIMSGRVVDLEVNPADPTIFYVAYASGGLWKTENNGLSFTPIFDNQGALTIGDFDVDWKNGETIWVGTGENNSSRSSYAGVGIFKSSDKGKTWQHLGLEETHHIGKVIIDPKDPNTVYVAALGHLFSANKERGVYKTTDGGKTWKQILYKDENTGAIDMQMDPINNNTIYVSLWYRERRAWDFVESGKTSGIYKTKDGGNTWSLISGEGSGFPNSAGVGRIGLAVYAQSGNIIYAIADNQDIRKKESKTITNETVITKDTLKKITAEQFLLLDNKKLDVFLAQNDFPKKYTAEMVKEMVKNKKLKPIQLAEFLEDANTLLFDSDVIGPELYKSTDEGKTWVKTTDKYINELFFTYGYYFSRVWISPTDANKIYLAGLFMLKSDDGGKTFQSMYADNVHADHHALWINPKRNGHVINGNDGGINISYDDGKNWYKCNTPAVGQFYAINYDMEDPYNIYGGLQDNGGWYGPSNYNYSLGWHQEGQYPYKSIMGGDGMQIQIDTRDNNTIYTGYQFGNYFRINKKTGETKPITPSHDLGERPYRWNWQAPILLSKHNQDIVYFCSNHFHRSMNKGDDFQTLSKDLTNGGKKGDVAYGTITCIDESELKFGLLYLGSDDGAVQVSKDGGYNWKRIENGLPKNLWVRRIIASKYDTGTVYVCLNGHTWDNFQSHIYMSKDFGTTWTKIGLDLPAEPVNVIREDVISSNILYVGTDGGVYVSLNKGKTFMLMNNGLPNVAVHDLQIQPKENELIVGTHGRSIYTASLTEIQKLTDDVLQKNWVVFDVAKTRHSKMWGKKPSIWGDSIKASIQIPVYVKKDGAVNIDIKTEDENTIYFTSKKLTKGINYISYDAAVDATKIEWYVKYLKTKSEGKEVVVDKSDDGKYHLMPGKYWVVVTDTATGKSEKTELIISLK
jgi:photosystem II stability/assembly factor-like uncharacterized protein